MLATGRRQAERCIGGAARGIAAVVALMAFTQAGCWSVGPDYQAPERPMPADWDAAGAKGTVAKSAAENELPSWWEQLHDPVLNRLIAQAVLGNPDARLAQLRIREARILLGQAEAAYGPTVQMDGSYSHSLPSRTITGANPAAHPRDLHQIGFDSTWEVDIFGGVRRGVESAEAQAAGIELDATAVQVSLIAEIVRNYVLLRELQEQTRITQNNLKSQTDTSELIKSRIKAGLATDLDLTRITALVSTTEAQLPVFESARRQTIHRIEVLLGQNPGTRTAELDTAGKIPTPPATIGVGVPSELLRRRPDIRIAERNIAEASAQIGVASADLYPRFSISGAIGLQSASLNDLGRTTASQYWSFGPSFRWPIFDWGRIRASVAAANVREEESLVVYEKTVLGALAEVEDALVAYDREQARRADLQKAVDANERAVQLATELYSKGLTSFIDVLQAQQSQYQAESNLVTNEAQITTNAAALYKALGGGWGGPAQPIGPGGPLATSGMNPPPAQAAPAGPGAPEEMLAPVK